MKALLSYRAIFALIAGFLCFLGQSSFAQDFYAGKTIRIIVGFPAGGGFDTYSRVFGPAYRQAYSRQSVGGRR